MGKAEIKVTNLREVIKKQKKDIATYHHMLNKIMLGLNDSSASLHTTGQGKTLNDYIHSGGSILVDIYPFFLTEDSTLQEIRIHVHDRIAFDCVRAIAEEYSDKYNHLEKIAIDTDF